MNFWDKYLVWFGSRWPVKKFVQKFVSGDTMEDAFRVAQELNSQGFEAIINFLGEEVKDRDQVRDNARIYAELIRDIHSRKLKARISVKPSQLGLKIDPALYRQYLIWLGRDSFIYAVPLEIDMETEDTASLTVQETVYMAKYFPGLDIRQAVAINQKDAFNYLFDLIRAGVKVRLCKGAYQSGYSEREVKQRYFSATSYLSRQKANPDFATHDLGLIKRIFRLRNEYPAVCGFQFLLGLRKRTWKELAGREERVAIYVPFGANWLPYAKRRWKYILGKIPSMIRGN